MPERVDYSYDSGARTLSIPFTGATKLTIKGRGSLFGGKVNAGSSRKFSLRCHSEERAGSRSLHLADGVVE